MAMAAAPIVHYGRRKGMARSQSALEPSPQQTVDLRQIAVIPGAEWDRILNYSSPFEKEARELYEDRKEREEMHLRSKELTKNWKNTITDLKQRPFQIRKEREEKEEAEKKKIDLEEAKFQAEKRKEDIENAKRKLFYENDRVKTFHSALLLTEVMKEREAQIELKKKMINANSKQWKDHQAQMQHELEQGIMKDQAKALAQATATQNTTDELLKQIDEHRRAVELERIVNKREGIEIERLTRLHQFETNKLAQMKMDQKRQLMMNHIATVTDRDFLRGLEQQKEKENDDKIQRFILAKKKMDTLKKEREKEITRKTIERRDEIGNLLAAQMKQKVDDEDERTARAVAELEGKNKRESQEKEEKIKADIKSITEHRLAMRRKQEMEDKAEKLKALQALHDMKEADNLFLAKQREKQKRIEDEGKKVQAAQIQQMAKKEGMFLFEKEAEINYAMQNNVLLSKEEDNFQQYAMQVIESATRAGRNPYPLVKVAQRGTGGGHGPVYAERGGIRPSYQVQDTSGVQLPAYKNDTTQQIKEIYDASDIQKGKTKLGFTW
uniref:Trichohyalin-plectin-homology domain-containing protein n=1 Tax=Leptobrachium leishanense TaxID=445787 RepID=A0A8C5RAR9_9ANUR